MKGLLTVSILSFLFLGISDFSNILRSDFLIGETKDLMHPDSSDLIYNDLDIDAEVVLMNNRRTVLRGAGKYDSTSGKYQSVFRGNKEIELYDVRKFKDFTIRIQFDLNDIKSIMHADPDSSALPIYIPKNDGLHPWSSHYYFDFIGPNMKDTVYVMELSFNEFSTGVPITHQHGHICDPLQQCK